VNYATDIRAPGSLGNLTLASGAAETKVTATLLSVNYDNGPLSVGGVYAKTTNPSTASNQDMTETALGGSYDLGAAKLFGTYQSNKADVVGANTNFESKV
jgi:predicted porin